MPYYDYECCACGHRFEAMQNFEEHDHHESGPALHVPVKRRGSRKR